MKIFSPWVWLVIGLAISLVILSAGFFMFWVPNTRDAAMVKAFGDQLESEGNKLPQAKKRVEDAKTDVAAMGQKWQAFVRTRTPGNDLRSGGINLAVNPYQLTVDTRKFRDSVQAAVNRQLKRGGVVVNPGPELEFPSEDPAAIMADYFNYPAFRYPVCIFDLGSVTVQGTYEQIKAHVNAWSEMPNYLAVTDGLAVSGTGKNLTGTYNLSIVAFIRGQDLPPALPGAGGAPGQQPAGLPGGGPSGIPGPPGGGGGRGPASAPGPAAGGR